jgi:hypothetical protein
MELEKSIWMYSQSEFKKEMKKELRFLADTQRKLKDWTNSKDDVLKFKLMHLEVSNVYASFNRLEYLISNYKPKQ